MANIIVTATPTDLNVTTTQSNITVTDLETNVSVNVASLDSAITVTNAVSNIIVGVATGVSNIEIRSALSAVSPILYDVSNGIISFDSNASFAGKTTDDLAQGVTNIYFSTSGAAVNTTNLPEGTNQYFTNARVLSAILDGNVKLKQYSETVVDSGTLNGNISLNAAQGTLFYGTINGNITGISISNFNEGSSLTLVLTQDGVGNNNLDTTTYTSNWTNWYFVNDESGLSLTAASKSYITLIKVNGIINAAVVGGEPTLQNYVPVNRQLFDNDIVTLSQGPFGGFYANTNLAFGNAYLNTTTGDGSQRFLQSYNNDTGGWITTDDGAISGLTVVDTGNDEGVVFGRFNPYSATPLSTTRALIALKGSDTLDIADLTANSTIRPAISFSTKVDGTTTFNNLKLSLGDPSGTERFGVEDTATLGAARFIGNVAIQNSNNQTNTSFKFGNINSAMFELNYGISNTITARAEFSSNSNITTSANVQGNYLIGNGNLITGIASNAGVVSYIATQPLTVGGNLTVNGDINSTGNVQGAFILGNGSQLTNLPANIAGSENITVSGNVVSLKNALSNVNSVTAATGQNFTINSTNKLVLTQQFKNTTTQTGNVTSDGYALFGGVNQFYLDPGFTYSGATNLDSIFLDSVTYTAGSNALTGVSISSTYAGDPATINSVLPYYVWTPSLPVALGGSGSTSFQTPFPYGTYVTSVDAANSIIYLNQTASTSGTSVDGGLQPGAYDSSTGLLLSFISEIDNTGAGSSTTIDVTYIHKFGAYGYPKSGIANTDFTYAIGNSSNYAITTSNSRPISEYMIGRTKIESDSIVLQAPRGLLVGNADMSVRSEGAAGPSFGVNVLWDGTANTTLEYGGATPVTQVLINQYSDGSPANVSGNETFTGPRILFTAARGNKNQDPSQTYARVNNELGRISWWTTAKNNLQLSTTSPPAWISAVSGNDHITYNSGLGLYFANSPNIDSTGRALYLASSKGNTLISSAANNSGVHQPIIFAPAHVTTSGNSVYHYNQTVVGTDNLASTSETPSGAHFGQFNYANTSALTGSRFSVTNGNNFATQHEGNIALSIDRNLNSANVTHFCRTGAVNYLGSSNPDRIRFTYTPEGLANATPVTISGFTNATVAGALNGNVFYVKGPFSAGGGLFSDYELYSDSGLTTGVNLGVTNINAGPGAITFTRTNGVTAKDWSFVLAQGSNSLVLAEDGVTRTTFAGGNITASYFIGDGSALTNVSAIGFTNFAVSGQSTVVADTAGDTMTLVAGSGMVITTDAATDTITFTSTGGYGNAEVANFLANGYGSNTISTTGNITAGNTIVNGVSFNTAGTTSPSSGQIVYNSNYGTHQVGLNGSNVMLMGQDLVVYARNDEANTLSKGEVVFIAGASGDKATIKRAVNNSDANSATTIGIVKSDIASGALGYVVSQGVVDGLNLGAYTAGDKLYLGNVAGTFTNVKPSSPEHYVFIGVVERANAGNGQILVRVQNGFELDEIHDIKLTNVQQNDILIRNVGNSLWVNQSLSSSVANSNITLKQFAETKVDLGTTNGNITLNMANGSIFTMTANGNISNIALANASIGSSGTLIITQDNVGSRLMTVTSAWKFAGASKTLTTTANAIDIVNFFTDGTTVYAALSKGYA